MSTPNPHRHASPLKTETRLRLRLTAAAEKQIRAGHPWVYADSVREQNRTGMAGELGVVFDRADKFLAVGFYDPDSPIRLRVLHVGKPLAIDAVFWRARLDAALARRAGLFDDHTTGYRVINGESDGWPGLVLDRYDTTLVMKVYTTSWRSRLEEIIQLISGRMKPKCVVLRMSRNLQEAGESEGRARHSVRAVGFSQMSGAHGVTRPTGDASPRGWRDGEIIFQKIAGSETGAPVVFLESGIRFEADVMRGQKTGFFLDQRENRRLVESLARGRTVLNAFSFSGGFSVYAARGGANSVTDLDISKHALESARRNFQLNWPAPAATPCPHESIQADAFAWLAGNAGRKFDLVVLDPPSLARREAERAGAIRAYTQLAESGLRHLSPGGLLVACSCSAHVTAEEFLTAVRAAARGAGRTFTEMRTTRHAPDHHASFREAEYLKGIFLRVS